MDFLFRITLAIAQMMKLSLVALRMGIIFWLTNDNDNESVKDQDNQVSRPNSPLQPNVSIEPSVSLTDGNQKEPRNVQKVDEGSDNDNCYSCNMCDTSFSVNSVDSQEDQSQYLSMWDVWWVFLQKVWFNQTF